MSLGTFDISEFEINLHPLSPLHHLTFISAMLRTAFKTAAIRNVVAKRSISSTPAALSDKLFVVI